MRFSAAALAAVAVFAIGTDAAGPITKPAVVDGKTRFTPLARQRMAFERAAKGDMSAQIVNGEAAKSGDAPFTVRILFDGYLCTGSLLSNKHVLTAGHCVTNNNGRVYKPTAYTVQVGGITTSTLKSYTVSKVTRNPRWNPNTLVGDLGILTLSTAITTGTNAQPVKIFSGSNKDRDTVHAFGWGQDNSGGVPSTLQTASLTVGDTSACKAQNSAYDSPNGVWTCTQLSLNGGNRAVCFGDSGGPLVRSVTSGGVGNGKWALIGATSYGITDACDDAAAIDYFDNANHEITWIAGVVGTTPSALTTSG